MEELNETVPEAAPETAPAADLKTAKSSFSRLGLGAFVMLAVGSALQMFCGGFLAGYFGEGNAPSWMMWLVTFAPLYCVAIPLGLLIMRRVSADPVPKGPFGAGRFLKLLPICVFLMYAGNLVGSLITSVIGSLRGAAVENPLLNYAMDGSIVLKALVLAVLAPVIEEFVFRRTLIDRMRPYGEKLAMVTSALMFGLFHGNLSQFFYAFALGLVFGYVYLRTGKLRYSAALHILVNTLGTVVAPALLEASHISELGDLDPAALMNDPAAMESLVTPGLIAFGLYAILLVVFSVVGLILLLVNAKKVSFEPARQELPKEKRFSTVWCNVGMGLFVLACVAMFAMTILL
ncbi:MAG: CPBP family intramembrane metalloprotease [Oscillospiraceae bacterium]|nr:CPBP family intramembrane metalloprotease [Oscillospiraceae bacterium]